MLMVGFGAVGQGSLPLVLRHIDIRSQQITIVTANDFGKDIAAEYGIKFRIEPLTRANYISILERELGPGDFLVNVSFDVSSAAVVEWCQQHGVLYIDACLEPWQGGHTDLSLPASRRSNYAHREAALALRSKYPAGPTAVLMHGANPGLVSHLVKQALLNLAGELGVGAATPSDREGWARLAAQLQVKVIHVSERDHQTSRVHKRNGEFVNTWSSEAFCGESLQPAELGWGTHERNWPHDAREYGFGCGAAIYLDRPGVATKVRSWAPFEGPFRGWLISHGEAISIPDYLTVRENGKPVYRPTCHYAYHPCNDAVLSLHEIFGQAGKRQKDLHILDENEIADGIDELGVLLYGHKKNAYWYGSQLSIDETRDVAPYQNATGLQVTSAVLAGMVWALENPNAGIVEADEMDYRRCLEVQMPYLGPVIGAYTDWTPLAGRPGLFPEEIDRRDPWQFKNVLVR